jgi:hypothetical protein
VAFDVNYLAQAQFDELLSGAAQVGRIIARAACLSGKEEIVAVGSQFTHYSSLITYYSSLIGHHF